jgi:alpha-1,3-rhamnosyl/mannosyltransferase
MRLAVDADLVGRNRSGNESYTRGIVRALGAILDPLEDTFLLTGSNRAALATIDTGRVSAEFVIVASGLRGDLVLGRKLVHAGAHAVLASYNAPLSFPGLVATVVHDVSFARVPQTYPWLFRQRLGLSVGRSARVSDFLVTVSAFSRDELLELYPRLDPSCVIVAPNGVSERFFAENICIRAIAEVRRRYSLPKQFALTVGNVQPRKNVPRLIEATRQLGLPLVLVGQRLWRATEVERHYSSHVTWLGYVPDGDLPPLYAACTVFAYPSLYEGFGLPIIEAMAAGAPVVTSDRTATRDVAGDAALTFNPESVTDMKASLERVLTEPRLRQWLRRAGIAHARTFSWSVGAHAIADQLFERLGVSR